MAKPMILAISVGSTVAETPHDTFTAGEVKSHDGVLVVPGIGDGLGRVRDAEAFFTIRSYSQATTYDAFSFDPSFPSFSISNLDVSAASEFSPARGGPSFEPVLVSHYQAGPIAPVIAGIGNTLNFLDQRSDAVPLEDLGRRHVEDGFEIDVEATSLATPTVNGVPNPTGVFGGLLSSATVVYEVEAKRFGGGDDTARGGASSDAVALGGGDDRFRAGGGDDAALGGGGRDRLWGQGGDDRLWGGGGDDRLAGGGGGDALFGNGGRDVLKGGGGGDDLDGGGGKDRLSGGGGGDELRGRGGRDRLDGGGGDDVLHGGGGRDRLSGGGGDDRLTGGAGADQFDFRILSGQDVVEDFEVGVDAILLTEAMADEWRALAGFTAEDGVAVYDDEIDVPFRVTFETVTAIDDLLDAIVVL